jgi:hypothetical protein
MAEQKTIGQIAEDAWAENVAKIEAGEPTAPCWEAAASAVWDQAVEACIRKITEDVTIVGSPEFTGESLEALGRAIQRLRKQDVDRLRSLKRSGKTDTDDLCQVSAGAKGDTVSATPLHPNACADAIELFSDREAIMKRWDEWRKYIRQGGDGDWPRMEFESVLDEADELMFHFIALKAANSQSSIEERSDTCSPASTEVSLTPSNQEADNG